MYKRIFSAIYNYSVYKSLFSETKEIPVPLDFIKVLLTEGKIFNYKQPIFTSFCHLLSESKPFSNFINQWALNSEYQWINQLDDYSEECNKISLLSNLIYGTLENIIYPNEMSLESIEKANTRFAVKILNMVNSGEKCIWNLLQRERFLAPKAGIVSFDKLVLLINKASGSKLNQIALYSQLDRIINKFGTSQMKSEFNEILKELDVWVKRNFSV